MTTGQKRRAPGEGGLYQRSDGKWEARLSLGYAGDGKRLRKKAVARTKAEAGQRLAAMRREVEKGLDRSSEGLTVGSWLPRWLAEAELRPRTRETYSATIQKHLRPAVGGVELRKLTAVHVSAYMRARLGEGASPQTVRNEHAILRRSLEIAARYSFVERNVARLVSSPKVPRAEVRPLDTVDVRKLLASAAGDRLEALYLLATSTGLRRAEVLGLSWADVDFSEGAVRVDRTLVRYARGFHRDEPKTRSSRRTIVIPTVVIDALRRHRIRQNEERLRAPVWLNDWGLVFTGESGEPVEPRLLHTHFKGLLKKAGVRPVRFHDLRHGAATYLLSSGVPMKVVQEILGHATMAMTSDLYSHVVPELRRDAADRIGGVLFGG